MQDFPLNPKKNQVVSYEGYIYQWNGRQWVVLTPPNPTTVPILVSRLTPTPPLVEGTLWYNTATSTFSIWAPLPRGLAWSQLASDSGIAITVSNASPKSPNSGDLWYNSVSKVLSTWTVLTEPASWMPLVKSPGLQPEPSAAVVSEESPLYPFEGTLWYQSSLSSLKTWVIRSGKGSWESVVTPGKTVKIDSSYPGITYVGKAPATASEVSPVWTITKSTFNFEGTLVSKMSANNVSWTGRSGHTYS